VTTLDDLFGQSENEPIPGGCDRCDAYQTVDELAPNVYGLTVHHDEWCPLLRAKTAGTN